MIFADATVRYLCGPRGVDAGASDGELLGRFIDSGDEAAFALLVRRHGDMVYGVCRRLLPESDAEDAFQATFLILTQKSRSIAPREAVGNWLYGVARRTALLARRTLARRRARTTQLTDVPAPPSDPLLELRSALDLEVSRLPDKLRTVIVLCDLETRTRKEAASILGWPEGTVAGRLAQARRRLAKRLALQAPAVSVATIFSGTAARAPAAVLAMVSPTERSVPPSVAALMPSVLASMTGGKLMKTIIAVLVLGVAGFGMSLGARPKSGAGPTPENSKSAAEEQPVKPEPVVFWGKEVDGLQAGLSLVETKTEQAGDTTRLMVKLEVKVRNVGKAPVTITYGSPWERAPTITDAAGKEVPVQHFMVAPILLPHGRVIEPGKTFSLSHPEFTLEVAAQQPVSKDIPERTVRVRPGAYTISYDWVADSHKELATGGLPFKVMDPDKVAKADREDDKVAWGQEVNGLQAGLALKDARPYRQGETATVVVRVRNIGKEEAKFSYCRETYFEIPPTVTDGKGKPVPLERQHATGFAALVPVNLGPGKEVEVGERQLELKPALFGPGKYSIQYEQLETPENDKTLSKLATGKLELEVSETKEAQRPAAPQGKKEAEGLTVWGKEVNGLQAGLSIRSGGEHASETSMLVVRIRNVGKETVKFSYLQPFVEHSFTVTGSDGKSIPQPTIIPDIGERDAGVVELAPGKEIVLHEFKRRFLPDGKSDTYKGKHPYALYHGTGKIGIRYDHVFGSPDMGLPGWTLDPALGKLSTGTLETTATDSGKVELDDPDDGPGGIVLRYFMAAQAGRIDDAVALAVRGTSPAKREQVEELAKEIKVIRRPTVHTAAAEALVVSEIMKFAKPQPDGAGQAFLVFKVVKAGGAWRVKDIDTTNLDGVIARVLKFKTGPDAAPPMPADAPETATGPRAIVERYLAAALAGRVDEAVGLAVEGASPQVPADRKQVAEFRKRVVGSEICLWKALANWDTGEAIAVTEEFRRMEFQPAEKEDPKVAVPPRVEGQPEGTRAVYASAFLVFKVVKSGDRWLVKDIDVTTEKDALDRVAEFKSKHPNATFIAARAADAKAGENKLVGTWKLISAKYDGEEVKFPEGVTTVKHVTPTHFMWAGYDKDGKMLRAAGGPCSTKGDSYQETPEYGLGRDFRAIKDKAQTFKWKIEGNRWHHTGKLEGGPVVDEVWERVEK